MTDLQRFAAVLNAEGDAVAEQARRIVWSRGGKDDPETEKLWQKAAILHEVAKAASKASEPNPSERL